MSESKKEQAGSIGSLENTRDVYNNVKRNVIILNSSFKPKIRGIIHLIKKQTKSTSKRKRKIETDSFEFFFLFFQSSLSFSFCLLYQNPKQPQHSTLSPSQNFLSSSSSLFGSSSSPIKVSYIHLPYNYICFSIYMH